MARASGLELPERSSLRDEGVLFASASSAKSIVLDPRCRATPSAANRELWVVVAGVTP
jgi:hypothetical protein